jgi:membrane-associated phospholipid phosphatase
MLTLFEYIGSYSNIILIAYILYAIVLNGAILKRHTHHVLTSISTHKQVAFFLWLIAMNAVINIILKNIIKDPRPVDKSHHGIGYEYGMPSGHAQISTFLFLLLFSINAPTYIKCISFIILMIIYAHRYVFQYHSARQIIGGIVVGSALWKLIV